MNYELNTQNMVVFK